MNENGTRSLVRRVWGPGLVLMALSYSLLVVTMPPPSTELPLLFGLASSFAIPLLISIVVFLLLVPGAILWARSVADDSSNRIARLLTQTTVAALVMVPFLLYLRQPVGYAIGPMIVLIVMGVPASLSLLVGLVASD